MDSGKMLFLDSNNNSNSSESSCSASLEAKEKSDDYEIQESSIYASLAQPLVASNCSDYVVAHSQNNQLRPVRHFGEVAFLPHILVKMRAMGLKRLQRLQSYAWPHLCQGPEHGVFIVSAPRSGRTLSYVPPLCQSVCQALVDKRRQRLTNPLVDQQGPIALVLVPDVQRVQQLAYLCSSFLRKARNEEWLTLTLTVPSSQSADFFLRLLNGVGCLVATPAQFVWLCEAEKMGELVKFSHLRYVAFDDVDLMQPEQVQRAHQILLGLIRHLEQRPQLVMVSQSFDKSLSQKLLTFNCQPMLIFGDILEAALYGGTLMRIALDKQEGKLGELLEVLKQRPLIHYRTLIYCQTDEEISRLVLSLEQNGFECLPYYQTADLETQEQVHQWKQVNTEVILLCTDNCPELEIRNANTLIHYSMSQSWSKFKLRHLALADNLPNHFQNSSTAEIPGRLHSLVLLDEGNQKQLPRLVDFLQMHQPVDDHVGQVAQRIRQELAQQKSNEPALCPLLLSMGDCGDTMCENRHQLVEIDRLPSEGVPCQGDIKVELVRVYSPVHYCVRLREHLPPGGRWQKLPYPPMQFLQFEASLSRYWPPRSREICTFRSTFGYERVRVLCVPHIANVNLSSSDLEVEVQAMDVDTRRFVARSDQLYECPLEFRDNPPLAVDLRVLGLIPFTGDRSWNEEDARCVESWLAKVPKPYFLQGNLRFAMSHTLFVQDLVVMVYAEQLKVHVRHLSISHTLLKDKLAKTSEQVEKKILGRFAQHISQPYRELQDKENEVQACTASVLPDRCRKLVELARKMGKENQLRMEKEHKQNYLGCETQKQVSNSSQQDLNTQEHHDIECDQRTKGNNSTTKQQQERSAPNNPVDSIEEFYNCMMRCALLDQEEQFESGGQLETMNLLNQVLDPTGAANPPISSISSNKKILQPTLKTTPAETHNLYIPSEIQPNIRRPEVSYYQTMRTLEFQVILPDDGLSYITFLQHECLSFRAVSPTSEVIQQFFLKLVGMYQGLRHHMRGRTVYITLYKAMVCTYAMDFSSYRFMKPNLDKFRVLDDERKKRGAAFERNIMNWVNCYANKQPESSDEIDSEDEQNQLEDVEYAKVEFECD